MDVAKAEADARRAAEEERERRTLRKSMTPAVNLVIPDFERSFEVKEMSSTLHVACHTSPVTHHPSPFTPPITRASGEEVD